jgi:prevent-host-death family protein
MSELRVGVRELRLQLSEYLRRVQKGQSITITAHGVPIGRIVPAGSSVQDRLQAMIDAGLAQWNGQRFLPQEPTIETQAGASVADLVSEARDDDLDYLS